ncbi:MAG: 30S ribosomal protein S20, partial [Candidatus Zixiibacteriota bacterium]
MPNHKSCAKRMKTSAEARIRNRAYRSRLRAAVRELRTESSKEVAAKTYRQVVSLI